MDTSNIYYGNSASPVTAIDLYACRACLVTDLKLFHIHKCGLAEIFAAFTSEAVPINDGFPQHLCHYCVSLLQKFETFKSKCERSYDILQTALLLSKPITTDYLRIIDRDAENLKLPLTIHDAGRIDIEIIEDAARVAEKDIKEEVNFDEKHMEIEEEVVLLPISSKIRAECEIPSRLCVVKNESDVRVEDESGITSENNDDELKLEAECDNDGSAMSTDHIKCEDQEDDMPLTTICSRSNVLKESLDANCDANLADELIDQFNAEDGEVVVHVIIEDVRSVNESEGTEKSLVTFEGADVVKQQSNGKANEAIKHSIKKGDTEDKQKQIANTQCGKISKTNKILKSKPIETTEKELNITQIYQCDICNKSFIFKANIIVHMKSHQLNSDKPIKIKKPKEDVTRKMKLAKKNKHTLTPEVPSSTKLSQRTNEKKLHQCDQCPYNTTDMSHFKDHIKIHTGENPYNCDFCNYKTGNKSVLIAHTRIHTRDKPFTCDICNYKASQKGTLNRHTRIHTGEKPFTCDFCNYKTGDKSALIAHTRIHTGEKPFNCDICNYKTSHKSNLISHTRIHTGEKPFTCNFCNYKTGFKSALIAHTGIHIRE